MTTQEAPDIKLYLAERNKRRTRSLLGSIFWWIVGSALLWFFASGEYSDIPLTFTVIPILLVTAIHLSKEHYWSSGLLLFYLVGLFFLPVLLNGISESLEYFGVSTNILLLMEHRFELPFIIAGFTVVWEILRDVWYF